PGDERLEEEVAQSRELVQDAPQGLAGELVHLAVTPGDGADHRAGAGQERDIAGELALVMDHDRPGRVSRVIDDLDLTRLDDEELEVAFAHRNEGLPVPVRPGRGG